MLIYALDIETSELLPTFRRDDCSCIGTGNIDLCGRSETGRVSGMTTRTETGDVATSATHSFKPYARSLSHELRTPMHGVIGMLDVMHATVQEALESQQNVQTRNIFQALKENIEAVQGGAASFHLP